MSIDRLISRIVFANIPRYPDSRCHRQSLFCIFCASAQNLALSGPKWQDERKNRFSSLRLKLVNQCLKAVTRPEINLTSVLLNLNPLQTQPSACLVVQRILLILAVTLALVATILPGLRSTSAEKTKVARLRIIVMPYLVKASSWAINLSWCFPFNIKEFSEEEFCLLKVKLMKAIEFLSRTSIK